MTIIAATRQDDGSYSVEDGRGRPWAEMPLSVRREACRHLPLDQRKILQETGLWVGQDVAVDCRGEGL